MKPDKAPEGTHWFTTEHTFVIPPENHVHVIISSHSNGQMYVSVEDYDKEQSRFIHRRGPTQVVYSFDEGLKVATQLVKEEIARKKRKEANAV